VDAPRARLTPAEIKLITDWAEDLQEEVARALNGRCGRPYALFAADSLH